VFNETSLEEFKMKTKANLTDYQNITKQQQATWSTGDFNEIARQNVWMAEALCQAADPRPGQRVLDVACGSGTAALVAARRYCRVAGIDYVPDLIERAQRRAAAAGRKVDFRVADAQALPYPDASFDVVLSVYGVQFAPDQEKAAGELLRVCRPGGTIALAGPIPEGWSGDFFAAHGRFAPPPPNVKPPLRWGTTEGLNELLGDGVRTMESKKLPSLQYYLSLDHALDVFCSYFGPTMRALRQLDAESRQQFLAALEEVFKRYNRATDGTAVVENHYLQTIAVCA
jgi:ubiquinone/menaquinone biosynthesis C-methylase UbiE